MQKKKKNESSRRAPVYILAITCLQVANGSSIISSRKNVKSINKKTSPWKKTHLVPVDISQCEQLQVYPLKRFDSGIIWLLVIYISVITYHSNEVVLWLITFKLRSIITCTVLFMS